MSSGIPPNTNACCLSIPALNRPGARQGRDTVPSRYIVDASGGRSLEVNLDLARNNIRVAGDIATAWCRLRA